MRNICERKIGDKKIDYYLRRNPWFPCG